MPNPGDTDYIGFTPAAYSYDVADEPNDFVVYSAPCDGYDGGGTAAAVSGPFVNFDKASTERWDFRTDRQPQSWRTFRLALAMFNPGASADVVWNVEVNTDGGTESAVTFPSGFTCQYIGASSYSFASAYNMPSGDAAYGVYVVLQRIGADAADTLDADAMVGSLFVVRLT